MATMWKFTADFCIPPALILTVLIMLPLPTSVRKGLLMFTRRVLFFEVFGGFKLVHFMQIVTLMSLIATSIHTYRLNAEANDYALAPNAKTQQLAKKWREERNFWIAVVAFSSWMFVGRSYALLVDYVAQQEQVRRLSNEAKELHSQVARQVQQLHEQQARLHELGGGRVPPPMNVEASAPPPPEHDRAQKKAL